MSMDEITQANDINIPIQSRIVDVTPLGNESEDLPIYTGKEGKEPTKGLSIDITPKKVKFTEKQMVHLFKKGQVANPAGRPKGTGTSIISEIKRKLGKVDKSKRQTYQTQLIDMIFKKALQGDDRFTKFILNYVEGMPKQSVDVQSDALPFSINIIRDVQ